MAIKPEDEFVGKINAGDANYPQGFARDINSSGDGTGTPWKASLLNDIWGFLQKLLDNAGITPSGSPDTVIASQYIEGLNFLTLTTVTLAELKARTNIATGTRLIVSDRGNGLFEAKTGLTGNDQDIIQSTPDGTRQYQIVSIPVKGIHVGILPSGSDQAAALLNLSTLNPDSSELEAGSYVINTENFAALPFRSFGPVTSNNPSLIVTDLDVGTKAKFNIAADFDNDAGSPLTLGIDESVGKLKRVNYRFGDILVDDTTPSHNLTLDSKVVIPRFRIRLSATGNNFPLTIQTATKLKEDATGSVVLATGEIATPIADFKSRGQTFVKITKGTGQGIVDFIYQYQDPKTKERKQALVWSIDLDDGLTPYFYRFLLPECSSSTMNGTYKLGDTTNLNWIIKARVGPVSIVSDGQNLADTSVVNKFLATIQPASLDNNEFISDYFEGHEINFINLKMSQQSGGNVSTITNIRIEVDL